MVVAINAIVGAVAAVIINYLSDVLPITRRLYRPICLNCGKRYSFKEYLFSFKCSKCGNKTSIRVILVTILTILSCILLHYFPLEGLSFWATIPIVVFLGIILVIDIEYRVVLIQTSIFGLVFFLIYGVLLHNLWSTLVGGLAGFLIMLGLYYLGVLFNIIMGRIRGYAIEEVALGFGDVYVCAFIGFFNGWPTILATLLIAIFASGAFSLVYILVKVITRRYQSFSAIPYAPFLVLAGVAASYLFHS